VVDYLDEKFVNTEKIKEKLKLDNVMWDAQNNVITLVDQDVEFQVPLANLKKTITESLLPLYIQFNWDKTDYRVSTTKTDYYQNDPCTFMMLYTVFHTINGVFEKRRFKGLGEMSDKAIAYTCVKADTRCFITIRGVGDLQKFAQYLDVETEGRKRLIEEGLLDE
jgi:DNA gyrase/topoisomerase IV subunit B